jgi:hypothetical protein
MAPRRWNWRDPQRARRSASAMRRVPGQPALQPVAPWVSVPKCWQPRLGAAGAAPSVHPWSAAKVQARPWQEQAREREPESQQEPVREPQPMALLPAESLPEAR